VSYIDNIKKNYFQISRTILCHTGWQNITRNAHRPTKHIVGHVRPAGTGWEPLVQLFPSKIITFFIVMDICVHFSSLIMLLISTIPTIWEFCHWSTIYADNKIEQLLKTGKTDSERCEISGSHGNKYEDDRFLGYSAV
jgi:hypothetical protein